jgi:hypothetical protein
MPIQARRHLLVRFCFELCVEHGQAEARNGSERASERLCAIVNQC